MKLITALFFALTLLYTTTYAQDLRGSRGGKAKFNNKRSSSNYLKRNKTDIFPLERIYRLGGWSFAPGVTYMWPESPTEKSYPVNDTSYNYTADGAGKIGLYLELAWFHSFVNPTVFHFVDFGIAYKQLKGAEDLTTSVLNNANTVLNNGEGTFEFNDQFLTFHLNATNHRHFSRYGFVNNTIGVNYDLSIGSSERQVINFPGREEKFPGNSIAQLHYKLGIGWKASPRVLIIPSIETPILTLTPFDGFKSRLTYFSSKYRPLIFSVRVMLLRLDPEQCNVPNYDGPSNFE